MLRQPLLDALALSLDERIRRYRELSLQAQWNDNLSAALKAEDRITRIAGFFRTKRPQVFNPLGELTARQRDELRILVEAAIERARRRDRDPQPPL
jgi:hypothetical protein